jgi:hypothetical protein
VEDRSTRSDVAGSWWKAGQAAVKDVKLGNRIDGTDLHRALHTHRAWDNSKRRGGYLTER